MVHPHNSGFALNFFKKILHIERDQQVDENNINVFSKKNLGQMNHFVLKNGASS